MKKTLIIAVAALLTGGCVVVPTYEVYRPVPAPPPPEPTVVVAGPVFQAPGVEVITVEPAPVERVYVYDPGYPPGCYFYSGYYWYGGYRYPHDVFVERYVTVNVHENRYVNVEENRRVSVHIEEQHRVEYTQTRGARSDRPAAQPAAARQGAAQRQTADQRSIAAQQQAMQRRTAAQQRTSAKNTDKY
jgi:hypothetical protein